LSHNGSHRRIAACRQQGVASAKRGSPQCDSIRIDVGCVAGESQRRAPVFQLPANHQKLARPASAVTEMAVSESQAGDARLGKPLGVRLQSHLTRGPKAMAHQY
jgi:hypothetical protein